MGDNLDVVLTANEAVEDCRLRKKDCINFKVDLEKAFDHVDWNFLDKSLNTLFGPL